MSDNPFFEFDDKPPVPPETKGAFVRKSFVNDAAYKLIYGKEAFDFELEKKLLIDNMNYLNGLDVEEFTFLKKYEEIKSCSNSMMEFSRQSKGSIWSPTDINNEEQTIKEISELNPKLIVVKTPEEEKLWTSLRIFSHTAEYNQAPGRMLKFLLVNETENDFKVLGFSSVASEVISISCRDEYLGWTSDNRLKDGMLSHSGICTTIAATQPFGGNFLGGKLIAAMMTSGVVRNSWEHDYKSKLVGLTTTSLYGPFSMYNGLKWWKPVGKSKGKIPIKMEDKFYDKWHNEYIKRHRADDYDRIMTQKEGVSGPVTGAKMRVLSMIFKAVGINQSEYAHGFERGVYYSCFYENTKEFLCKKIQESELKIKPLFSQDSKAILDWWRPKAIERYKRLKLEGRLSNKKLFYSDIKEKEISFEEAKSIYLKDVGNTEEKEKQKLLILEKAKKR